MGFLGFSGLFRGIIRVDSEGGIFRHRWIRLHRRPYGSIA